MFEEILSIFGICGIFPIFFFAILLGAIIFISTYSESDTVSMLLMILLLISNCLYCNLGNSYHICNIMLDI